MANAAAAPDRTARYNSEKVVGFVPEQLAAPFFLRVGAAAIDYMLLMSMPVLSLFWERYFADGTGKPGPGGWTWMFLAIVWAANYLLFPLLRGQTVGKFLTGLSIVNRDGTPVRLVTIVIRHTIGYLLTVLTLGLGFVLSVFSPRGKALDDLISGTLVVRGRRTQV
jgi:uncharacterized RDD family membrane protein YckC